MVAPHDTDRDLVPRSFAGRALARKGSNSKITTAVKATSGEIDAGLSKKLDKTVSTVARHVDSARSSFSSVQKIINDPKLQLEICKDDVLSREWTSIEANFMSTLTDSRKVATNGATLIADFLSTIIPYLLKDGGLKQKQGEIVEYRTTLERSGDRAALFANDLMGISKRVADFRKKWAIHSTEAVRRLHIETDNLQRDVDVLTKSVDKAQRTFISLAAQRIKSSGMSDGDSKRALRSAIKEHAAAEKKQDKSQKEVSKQTVTIEDKTNDVAVVWNLIYDDINVIESQLEICENGNSTEVFKQRVEKLAAQYYPLMEVLRKYTSALSTLDGPVSGVPFWRKLIGQ